MTWLRSNWRIVTMVATALLFVIDVVEHYLRSEAKPSWQGLALALVFAYLKKGPGDLTKGQAEQLADGRANEAASLVLRSVSVTPPEMHLPDHRD